VNWVSVGSLDLQLPADLADSAGRFVAGAQQAGVDELVEMEGGELAGYPDTCRGLVAGGRAAGTADEGGPTPARALAQDADGVDAEDSRMPTCNTYSRPSP
jgi:hypothetical protein